MLFYVRIGGLERDFGHSMVQRSFHRRTSSYSCTIGGALFILLGSASNSSNSSFASNESEIEKEHRTIKSLETAAYLVLGLQVVPQALLQQPSRMFESMKTARQLRFLKHEAVAAF
jgi:hypothetical protein